MSEGVDPDLLAASRFVPVFPWMLAAVGGDSTSAIVLGYVMFISHRGQRWAPVSVAKIADEVGLSEKQARRGLDNVRALGLVVSRRIESWNPAIEVTLVVAGADAPTEVSREVPISDSRDDPAGATRDDPAGAPLIRKGEEVQEVSPSPARPAPPAPARRKAPALYPADTPEPTAQTILAGYIDFRTSLGMAKMNQRTIGQLAGHIGEALRNGYGANVIKRALIEWHSKDYGPASLPSFIDGAERQRVRGPVVAEKARGTPDVVLPSDQRVATGRTTGWE